MKTINLKPHEFLSDYAHHIPTAPGQYLIKAQTGVGKTFQQIRMSQKKDVYAIFPVKSIVAQQKEEAKAYELNSDNIIQLEHFLSVADGDIKSVILDECQWLYEGGFRQAIAELFEKLERLSKTIPIYYFSGTYDSRFSPIEFADENIIEFNKPFERILNTYQLNVSNKGLIDPYKTEIKQVLVEEIRLAKQRKTCVLFFLNSEATLTELAERLKKDGYTADVYHSGVNANKLPSSIKHLFETSTIANCGVDIILSTSSLEAGININDDVTIVSVPDSEGRLVQRFGRARKAGRYVLIHGVGEDKRYIIDNGVQVEVSSEQVETQISYDDFYFNRCLFSNRDHKAMCDRYAMYASASRRMNYSTDILHTLQKMGYNAAHTDSEILTSDLLVNRDSYRKISKSKMCETIYAVCGVEPTASVVSDNRKMIIKKLVTDELPRQVVKIFVNRAIETITQIQGICRIKKNPVEVFKILSIDAINMLRVIDYRYDLEKQIDGILETLEGATIKADKLDQVADAFWSNACAEIAGDFSAWLSEDMAANRRKLFRYIAGIENEDVDHRKIKKEKSWWKDKLETASEKAKYSQLKKAATEAGADIEKIHEESQLTRSQLVSKFSLGKFKESLSTGDDASWF